MEGVKTEIKQHIHSSDAHMPSFPFNKHCTSSGNDVSHHCLISRGKQIEV